MKKLVIILFFLTSALVIGQLKYKTISLDLKNATDSKINYSTSLLNIFSESQMMSNFLETQELELTKLSRELLALNSQVTTVKETKLQVFFTNFNKSFFRFTNFNTKYLFKIESSIQKKVPIKGNEILFISNSFSLYKKYAILNQSIQNLLIKNNLPSILLESQLSQLQNFYLNYSNSIKTRRIRRILNEKNKSFNIKKNDLKKLARKQLKRKNFKAIKKKISQFDVTKISRSDTLFKELSSKSYRNSFIKKDNKKFRKFFKKDKLHNTGRTVTQFLSGLIGNFIGLFKFRKGYLFKNDSIYNELFVRLKPLDIIAEKTRFLLTDKLIIGHFGHVAIYLGTKKQLENNHLWNHPVIVPFQKQIQDGFCIIETNRRGTHLKKLKQFLNVDEIAILRITNFNQLPIKFKLSFLNNSLGQLGKKYDFNFDTETNDKLICSELLYNAFGAIHWPYMYSYNRFIVTPDNLVSLALYKNTPISLQYYISSNNKKDIANKNLNDLAKNLGFTQKNDGFILINPKCKKDRFKHKEPCTKSNKTLENLKLSPFKKLRELKYE
jgi:hypothetical protein